MLKINNYSINKFSNKLLNSLIEEKNRLNINIQKGPLNCRIVDAGIDIQGSIEAGIRISEICLGGLGKVSISPNHNINFSSFCVSVHSSLPVLACLGSQYAG